MDTPRDDIEVLLTRLRDLGPDLAQARAYRTYIEEWKKSKIAILMKEAERAGIKTAAGQEREALASEEYQVLLTALQTAVETEEKLRYQMRHAEHAIEAWRTLRADERMERKAYGA